MDNLDDDYYKGWPQPITEAELETGRFLRSLTPAEELACFLAARGHCLLDTGRRPAAAEAYAAAHRLVPEEPIYSAWRRQAEGLSLPTGFVGAGPSGFREPPYGRDRLAEVRRIEAINRVNMQRLTPPPWPPQPAVPSPLSPHATQPGVPPPPSPYGTQSGFPQPYQPPAPGFPQPNQLSLSGHVPR